MVNQNSVQALAFCVAIYPTRHQTRGPNCFFYRIVTLSGLIQKFSPPLFSLGQADIAPADDDHHLLAPEFLGVL